MTHTLPTSAQSDEPTLRDMLEEVMDLVTGASVALMPLLLLAMPGIVIVVVPVAVLMLALALPLAVLGLPPYLLARALRRRRPTDGATGRAVPTVWQARSSH